MQFTVYSLSMVRIYIKTESPNVRVRLREFPCSAWHPNQPEFRRGPFGVDFHMRCKPMTWVDSTAVDFSVVRLLSVGVYEVIFVFVKKNFCLFCLFICWSVYWFLYLYLYLFLFLFCLFLCFVCCSCLFIVCCYC